MSLFSRLFCSVIDSLNFIDPSDDVQKARMRRAKSILDDYGLEAIEYSPDYGVNDPALSWAIMHMTDHGHLVFVKGSETIVGKVYQPPIKRKTNLKVVQ